MADLLECLIQIKALRETTTRIVRQLEASCSPSAGRDDGGSAPRPSDEAANASVFVAALVAAEETYAECLTSALPQGPGLGIDGRPVVATDRASPWAEAPTAPRSDDGATDARSAPDRFLARRQQTLAILDRCSAADLSRMADYPGRSPIPVADLVAIMLAHDTEVHGVLMCR